MNAMSSLFSIHYSENMRPIKNNIMASFHQFSDESRESIVKPRSDIASEGEGHRYRFLWEW
jgi:hypothetical protein